jgi:peroxin-1
LRGTLTKRIKKILEAVSRKVSLAASVDLGEVAQATEGFSGADLQALIYNAHLEVVNTSIASASEKGPLPKEKTSTIRYTAIGGLSRTVKSKAEESAMQTKVSRSSHSTDSPG